MYRFLVGVGIVAGIVTLLVTTKVQAGCENCLYLPAVAGGTDPATVVSDYLDQQSQTVYTLYLDVRNDSTAPICDLAFTMYFEREGMPRLEDKAYTLLPKIDPGQSMPMVAVVTSLSPITGYTVHEQQYSACQGIEDVAVSPVVTDTVQGWIVVEGTVTNVGAASLKDVRAAVAAYWPDGRIRYARVGYLFPGFDLQAGATKFYREQTYEQVLGDAPLKAWAQGYK